MDKPATSFMTQAREDIVYRPVGERVRDFAELAVPQRAETTRAQASRCMDCGIPFCQGDTGCPLGNLIPEWNALAAAGDWEGALRKLHATNNFPEFTSKLCPAPCESACVLGLHSDAVTIKSVEKQIIDRGHALGLIRPIIAARKSGRRIAIVGSGPAGLAAAQELARKGHAVTVFEKADRAGGLIRYGIPDFKMEKKYLDLRLEQMRAEGVTFRTGVELGRDVTLEDLTRDYHAVGLALGAEQPRDLDIPGRGLAGVHFAMDYLVQQNRALAGIGDAEPAIHARGKRVIVIGGGDTGSDCIGTARRQGALSVHQFEIMPEPPRARSEATPWPRWPLMLRTSHAHEEGATREWSLATKEFLGVDGRVTFLVTERDGKELRFGADLVLLAMGFTGPRPGLLENLTMDDGRTVQGSMTFRTSLDGVFIAGDARRGASLIVWAIAEGRKMAVAIDEFLGAQERAGISASSARLPASVPAPL